MDARYYCQHCEAPYSHPKSNFMRCNAGCVNCSGLGVGFPCENIRAQGIFCSNCKKTFYNDSYYQRHLSNKVCNQFTKCLDCGVIWNHDTHKKKGSEGHECGKMNCKVCHLYHRCFIQQYKPRPQKPYRIIVYDFESQQIQIITLHL